MTFDEVLSQVQELLQREQRVSYRGLKRRFDLDDEYLEDLKEELVGAKRLAADEDGRFLVWRGDQQPAAVPSPPLSYQSPVLPTEPRPPEAERRQQLHQQIAHVLEERFVDIKETQPELLAHHYTEAGLIEQAIPYWQAAGQRATQSSANIEATSHLTKALEMLKTLPDTPERVQQELMLQIALGVPLMATKGFAAPEVGAVYRRARELCQHVGETPQLFSVLFGLWAFYAAQAELHTARELGEQGLRLARNVQDSALLVAAHYALEATLANLGEGIQALEHFEQLTTLYNPHQHRSLAFLHGGVDPQVVGRGYVAAGTLWLLGYPDQAVTQSHAALALAQELAHPFSLVWALLSSAWLHQYRREEQLAHERAKAVILLALEQGFALELGSGTNVRGWALVEQGQVAEGTSQMHRGLAAIQATGTKLGAPYNLASLAEAYGKVGQVEDGLNLLVEALSRVDRTGERFYEAELYRLKGILTLQSTVPGPQSKVEAEACFLKAIEIARQQQAKSLELRASTSLARLWQQQGKRTEAHKLLSETYNWFTEGFDTKDLQEAKALLEELT